MIKTGPKIHSSAFVAQGTSIIGDVTIGEQSSVWFNCILRGDVQKIVVGSRSNIQEDTIIHVTTNGLPTLIGDDVTIGHGTILHACTIETLGFVGFGARVFDGAVVKSGGMLATGAVLTPGKIVGPGELWAGVPAKFTRLLNEQERREILSSARRYVEFAACYGVRQFSGVRF